jgi:methyltransferase of ATP-grasp peptide maturase system
MTIDLIDAPDAAQLRQKLAHALAASGAIRTTKWRRAFTNVPRHLFAPTFMRFTPSTGERVHVNGRDPAQRERWLHSVYADDSLVTALNDAGTATSSSTQPTVMAFMLEALDVRDGMTVLEIGTGTGYNAALLCHRLGDTLVTSVDIDPVLVEQARDRLSLLGYHPRLATTDGLHGYPPSAPYDRIIGTCSTARVPAAWLAQTRPGGIIVANVGLGVVPLLLEDDGTASGRFLPDVASFIEVRPADGPPPLSTYDAIELILDQVDGEARGATLFGDAFDEECVFVTTITTPSLFRLWSPSEWYGVAHGATRSWARAEQTDGGATVVQGGPRRLWDELETAHAWWTAAARPAHDRLGLTVYPDGRHTLWVDEPGRHALALN